MSVKTTLAAAFVAIPILWLPVGIATSTPAQAAQCIINSKYTAKNDDFSNSFNASIQCGGVYARYAAGNADYVQGRYNRDGWKDSGYGFQYVPAQANGSANQVIGNTVDGRECRGNTMYYNHDVGYRY